MPIRGNTIRGQERLSAKTAKEQENGGYHERQITTDRAQAGRLVDKKDSIFIESQIEFCKYELKGGSCGKYTEYFNFIYHIF
jgi:hypothetical protein